MLATDEVMRSVRESKSVQAAAQGGHFARGWTIQFGGSDRGQVYRAELLCSYCGGHLHLKRSIDDSQSDWKLQSENVLSESCDARHESVEKWYRRTFRNLDEALREQMAKQK
jgi:hypothetical protein